MYDADFREFAVELAGELGSDREAAAEMGVSPDSIARWRARGPRAPRKRPVYLPQEARDDAVRRVLAGEHYRDVAADLGVTGEAVLRWRGPAPDREGAPAVPRKPMPPAPPRADPSGLPDDPAELKRMVAELQLENDVVRQVVELVKKRPRRRPGGADERGEGPGGGRPQGDAFSEVLGPRPGDRRV